MIIMTLNKNICSSFFIGKCLRFILLLFTSFYFICFELILNFFDLFKYEEYFYLYIFILSVYFSSIIGSLFLFFKNTNTSTKSFIYMGVSLAIFGYITFFAFLVNGIVGLAISFLFKVVISIFFILSFYRSNYESKIESFRIFIFLILLINTVIFFGTINKFDYSNIQEITSNIYGLKLPIDNWLPKFFADQLISGKVMSPMLGDWLSSDRPPLQTGMYLLLSSFAVSDLSYITYSVGMQLLLIVFLMLVFKEVYNSNKLSLSLFILIFFNNMVFVNSLFVWPKMLSAFFQAIAFYSLYKIMVNNENKLIYYKIFAISFVFAFLSHGGSIFFLIGLFMILMYIMLRTNDLIRVPLITLYMILFYIPWIFYQKLIDPPGDRLLKWHLADYIPITNESFIHILIEKYSSFSIESYITYKLVQVNTVFGELFSKYISFINDSSSVIINKSFYYQEYSYLLFNSIFLLLIFFIKIENQKEKIFIYLLVISYILYNIIWIGLLMSQPVLHHGSSFGWFSGIIAIFLVTKYFNKFIAILLLIGNLFLFYNLYIKSSIFDNKNLIKEKAIINTAFVKNAIFNKKSINGFVIYGSNINGDKDIATIKFEAKKGNSLLIMTGPVISNQIMTIFNTNGTIISKETLEKSDNWKKYSFSKDLPESFIVEISDNGSNWGEWSAVAFKKDNNDIK